MAAEFLGAFIQGHEKFDVNRFRTARDLEKALQPGTTPANHLRPRFFELILRLS
jgi:hypothetical protein